MGLRDADYPGDIQPPGLHISNTFKIPSMFQQSDMPYSCPICPKSFMTKGGLSKHISVHEGRKYTCQICDRQFNQKSHKKRHLLNTHQLAECQACSNIFQQGSEFNQHVLECPAFQDTK